MPPAGSRPPHLGPPLVALLIAACAPSSASDSTFRGSIDTLPDGTVAVVNPAGGMWNASSAWRVEVDLTLGSFEGTGPELFGQITDIAVDPAERIWVLEGQAQEVRVFDREGRHVRTIGRKGGGPGEFSQAIGMDWGPDGNLWIPDPQNARITVIDTAGELVRMIPAIGGVTIMPWPGGFGRDGYFYTYAPIPGAERFRIGLVRYDTAMTPLDTIRPPRYTGPENFFEARTNGGFIRAGVPFSPGLAWRLVPAGGFWALETGTYRLLRITFAGDTLRTVTRAFDPLPVTGADIDAAIERLEWFTRQGGKIDRSKFPSTKTPVTGFVVDDEGYLWVARRGAGEAEGVLVDVFDPEGRYLGELTLPFGVNWGRTPRFKNDMMYVGATDDLEVPRVVRARVVKP